MKDKQESIDITKEDEQLGTLALQYADPSFSADRAIEMANERIKFIDRVRVASLQMTRPGDWVKVGKGFYLQATGAEKMHRAWGIYWRDVTIEKVEEGGQVFYEVWGTIGSNVLKCEIPIFGGRSADDDFFAKQKDLDPLDVRKAAFSNFIARGTMILLGMRNMSGADLEAAGINPGETNGYDFKKGAKSAQTAQHRAEWTDELTENVEKIGKMLMEMAGGDADHASELLESHTSFEGKEGKVPGLTSIKDLTPKRTPPTYGRVKKAYEEYLEKIGATE